jgi:uncharacterized cupin superfamily protein
MSADEESRLQRTAIDGISMWSRWQSERAMFWNSFVVESEGVRFLVDPLPLGDGDVRALEAAGGVAWIVVTTRDHERAARELAQRFGAKIAAPALDAAEMAGPVDRELHDDDVVCGARVIALEGMKSPGEFGLWLAGRRTAILGDALWGDPPGSLRMVPDAKLADPIRAVLSLRRIRAQAPEHLLVGDGACLFGNAGPALETFFRARADAFSERINLDELHFQSFDAEPPPYGGRSAEVGFAIGARRIGYRVAIVAPGTTWCPYHWHTREEELFYVIDGTPTVRVPHGEFVARPGDFIAFPPDPSGAHKLWNASERDCTIVMLAATDSGDTCFYPDSRKLLVEASDTLVRDYPQLDYYDGETVP